MLTNVERCTINGSFNGGADIAIDLQVALFTSGLLSPPRLFQGVWQIDPFISNKENGKKSLEKKQIWAWSMVLSSAKRVKKTTSPIQDTSRKMRSYLIMELNHFCEDL